MIRFASQQDITDIMKFIDTYWKNGHILGRNEEFFQYEHNIQGEVSYVISKDEQDHINAILGYIPYGKRNRDVMTVIWKANHTCDPFLGIRLLQYLTENGSVRIAASPGINKKTRGVYQYLGYTTGKMTHWYRLNYRDNYKIAYVVNKEIPIVEEKKHIQLIELKNISDLEEKFDFSLYQKSNPKPYKEKWYIEKRYFNHPIYRYNVFGLESSSKKIETILVFRNQECNGSNVLRMIDCIGKMDNIEIATTAIDNLTKQYDAEYVDCYETGLKNELFLNSGWKKADDSGNIIPNYFSPYLQENIDIYYFSTAPDIVLFKGDGDQDRPN
jgi:hypothetical protein